MKFDTVASLFSSIATALKLHGVQDAKWDVSTEELDDISSISTSIALLNHQIRKDQNAAARVVHLLMDSGLSDEDLATMERRVGEATSIGDVARIAKPLRVLEALCP